MLVSWCLDGSAEAARLCCSLLTAVDSGRGHVVHELLGFDTFPFYNFFFLISSSVFERWLGTF